ncbi:MAG: ABC transporter permease [Deltaproteobacteria bacterium]|nr:ABC transporter permease [Deltaproteobacteria bacterium]MBW2447198.1 ABC transporter permease [Deltaproteobacteria bacterium]
MSARTAGRARPLRALFRKELQVLFGSPVAYMTLTFVGLVTALLFFDHLRVYNQVLFVYTSNAMRGFEAGTIPDHVNLRDQVFVPLMETLAITLIGIVPLVTMRVFAEERSRGTDELLLTSRLSPNDIVFAKFTATYLFVAVLLAVSFVYPATSVVRAGLGLEHLGAVYLGLLAVAVGIASIGLACSAFTGSQLIAAISAYAIAFVMYDFGWASPFVGPDLGEVLARLSFHARFSTFSEGLVVPADAIYFLGVAAVCIAITRGSLDFVRVR